MARKEKLRLYAHLNETAPGQFQVDYQVPYTNEDGTFWNNRASKDAKAMVLAFTMAFAPDYYVSWH